MISKFVYFAILLVKTKILAFESLYMKYNNIYNFSVGHRLLLYYYYDDVIPTGLRFYKSGKRLYNIIFYICINRGANGIFLTFEKCR